MKKLALIFFSLLLATPVVHGDIIEAVLAIVNGSAITKLDMEQYRRRLRSGAMVDDLLGADHKKLLKNRKALLNHMIDEKLIDDEVKANGLSVTVERVEQEISTIQRRNGITREQLQEALKRENTRFSDYQNFIKKRLERHGVIGKAITSKIKISDEDVIAAYEAKSNKLSSKSFEYKIAHILLRKGKRSDSEQLKRAKLVLKKVKGGESFEKLASQYSEDLNFNDGGLLGTFRSGEFLKPLENGIKVLAKGEVGGPVKTKLGYHILKLVDRKIVPDAQFEKNKEKIRAELYQKAFVKQFKFWLDQKRRLAFIRINK